MKIKELPSFLYYFMICKELVKIFNGSKKAMLRCKITKITAVGEWSGPLEAGQIVIKYK